METQVKAESRKTINITKTPSIKPFLWFATEAEEAVNFYVNCFVYNSTIRTVTHYGAEAAEVAHVPEGTVMTIDFQLDGVDFVALNGGPVYKFSPTISFFVSCESKEEIDRLWGKFSDGGKVLMDLDRYPFSEKYGWIRDKFGISWQLFLDSEVQKISPCLMFVGQQQGRAEEAINYYISVFGDTTFSRGESKIVLLERYGKDEEGPEGQIVHARFALNGYEFVAMDSHVVSPFSFNPSISFVVICETQEEVDHYWTKLSKGRDPLLQQCGWLQDKFGVSWQVVPSILARFLNDPDHEKSKRVMSAMLSMKKIDITALKEAYDHA